jgi:type IV pilus assembly protein PilW
MRTHRRLPFRYRQRGAGIIETMVGILIGMVVLLAVYNVLAFAEGYKRTAVGVSDAQVTGQFAQFVLARELASAGNGVASALEDLATCNNDWRLKPIPVLITDGGTPNTPDSMITYYSNARRVVSPVLFSAAAPIGSTTFQIQSPNGFFDQDWVVATDRVNNCTLRQLNGPPVAFSANPGSQGRVTVPFAGVTTVAFPAGSSRLVNLGQINRTQYTVNTGTAGKTRQLYSQDVNIGVVAQPVVPIAQNVMLLKAQYGIDTNGDLSVDCWTAADNSNTCADGMDYSAAAIGSNATTAATIRRIKAVRIAVVVRSDEADLKDAALIGQTAFLFNCSVNTNAGCPGRIAIDNTTLQDGFRYRIYETTVPLRNMLWNQT